MIAFIYADLITLPILLIYRKYYGTHFAFKLTALMFATMVIAALLVGLVFSALGVIPDARPSIESITDRGISLIYTAVLNILFSIVGAALVYLTVRRGAKDPVCRMRVDRYMTPHRAAFDGRTFFFCSFGCKEEFETKPDHYARHAHGTRGGRPPGLLRPRT